MACLLYKLENTGTTSQIINIPACVPAVCLGFPNVITINSGETFYANSSSLSSIGNIVVTPIVAAATTKFNFSSICDNTEFFIYSDETDIDNPFSGLNQYYCFHQVESCVIETPTLFGCYELISTGTTIVGLKEYQVVKLPSYDGPSSGDCLNTCPCCDEDYCVSDTGFSFDGNYVRTGYYNSYPYWFSSLAGYYIYYSSSEDSWCLSSSLGGICELFGPSPCFSNCPDLCDDILLNSVCPTPTPTPTINCDVFDFSATFDCLVTPTPSVSPTPTITPTVTPTLTPNIICSGVTIDANIQLISSTPTPTPTITPTSTITIIRGCEFNGDVTFNIIDTQIKCPLSKEFKDCINEVIYYTTLTIPTPSGTSLDEGMVFIADVNGVQRCIHYVGENYLVSGINTISLKEGPLGYVEDGACSLCPPPESPTPTPTMTQTPTPTPTITPTISPIPKTECIVYRVSCSGESCKVLFNGCCSNQNQTSINLTPQSSPTGGILLICSTTVPTIIGIGTVFNTNQTCQGCFTSQTPTPTKTQTPTPTVSVTPTVTPTPTPTSNCIKYSVKPKDGLLFGTVTTFSFVGCCSNNDQTTLSITTPVSSLTQICSTTYPTSNISGSIILPGGVCPDC